MIRIGVIGCADIAGRLAIPALKEVDNCRLVAIASRDVCKAQEWAGRYSCEIGCSYDEVLSNSDVDAVYIPLPIGLHEEWVIKAARAGKHVICEKSLSDNYECVERMIAVCKSNDVVLYENIMCEYHPQHQEVVSLISEGEIGDIHVFRGYFGIPPLNKDNIHYDKSLGGGSLNNLGTYPLYMARIFLGSEPIAIQCDLYCKDKEVDIRGSAYLEFSENRVAFIAFGFDNLYQNNYSIWGSKGLINVGRAYSMPPDMKPQVEVVYQGGTEKIDLPPANQFKLIFESFCKSIVDGRREYSHISRQAKAMQALRVSAEEGRKIRLDGHF